MSDAQEFGPGLAVLLGVVEGLTEFLPISSTGHLIIVGHWLGFTGAVADSVEVCIQLGAILAVIAYERGKIASLLSRAAEELGAILSAKQSNPEPGPTLNFPGRSSEGESSLAFLFGLAVAFLPAALVGFWKHDWIEANLFSPVTVAVGLIAGGAVLLWVEATDRRARIGRLEQVGLWTALWVGMAQCAALFPGISRSGATIVGGLLTGMDRRTATEYSFFLALPTMIIATLYKMYKSLALMTQADLLALALGLLTSFLVAWIVIAAFLAFVKQHTLRSFAYYRIVLGALVLLVFAR
jgi:undecaprenyl-diphosphatase